MREIERAGGKPCVCCAIQRRGAADCAVDGEILDSDTNEVDLHWCKRHAKVARSHDAIVRANFTHSKHATHTRAAIVERDIAVHLHAGKRAINLDSATECATTRNIQRRHQLLDKARINTRKRDIGLMEFERVTHRDANITLCRRGSGLEIEIAHEILLLDTRPLEREIHGRTAIGRKRWIQETRVSQRHWFCNCAQRHVAVVQRVPTVENEPRRWQLQIGNGEPHRIRVHLKRALKLRNLCRWRRKRERRGAQTVDFEETRLVVGVRDANQRQLRVDGAIFLHTLKSIGDTHDHAAIAAIKRDFYGTVTSSRIQ